MDLKRQLGPVTGVLVIVADMIGTGIFMTTGNILGMTGNALLVLTLWCLGGLVAITGSLCYAELAAMWPDEGGEYQYLKMIFGYLPAFLTGWISLMVGFSAPVATGSILLVEYIDRFITFAGVTDPNVVALFTGAGQKGIAIGIIVFFTMMHIVGVRRGGYFQNGLTVLKIALVVSLIVLGFWAIDWSNAGRLTALYSPAADSLNLRLTGLALLMVMFAYSGWNSATYIAGEIRDPGRNLPRILLAGTLLTTVLYLLINVVYLMAADGPSIMGKDEVGAIVTSSLFSPGLAGFFTLFIVLILLSAVSVQMMVGPRVCYAMAQDGMIFRSLSAVNDRFGTPHRAILVQMFLAILYIVVGNAMTLIIYMGFALNIFPLLTVIGLVYMRIKRPDLARPFRVPWFPVIPAFYIAVSASMMIAALMNWTETSLFAIGVVLAGIPVYYLWRRFVSRDVKGGRA
ncbi:MAG TPA: amino acid permease [Spirochaetota bacterium]|nr:amino acid permease [Spirochaetota bacterium]HSA13300.1 amino acid permease [Spirochaetota bacterium]